MARLRRGAYTSLVVAALALGLAGPAFAYVESQGEPWGTSTKWDTSTCTSARCHGVPLQTPGPHARYGPLTDKCSLCHEIHEAAESARLLVEQSATALCNSCHDLSFTGTGGEGVYGAIRARGGVVLARHGIRYYNETETAPGDGSKSYEATSVIPGGDGVVRDREGGVTDLECISCHTPHGRTVIPLFWSDRRRADGFSSRFLSNKALRDDLQMAPKGTYTDYGSRWCAACHDRRHSGNTSVNTHPTQNDPAWGYGDVTYTVSAGWPGPGLGLTNAGYTMDPAPSPPAGNGRVENRQPPMCQQCHEDPRDVESVFVDSVSAEDDPTLRPRYRTFPHETQTRSMVLETGDDLCMNCHPTSALP